MRCLMKMWRPVFRLLQVLSPFSVAWKMVNSGRLKEMLLISGAIIGALLFLYIAYVIIRHALVC